MATDVTARPAGRDDRPRHPSSGRARRGLARFAALVAGALMAAASLAPAAMAAEGLTVTTPYPAVAVAPGSDVNFELSVLTAAAGRVDLVVEGVPEGWTATLRGGGFVVDGVQTTAGEPATVTLDVTVPAEATGSGDLVVRATSGALTTELPLTIRIEPEAAGDVTLTTDFPQLRGPSDSTFRFTLDLANDTPEDLTFAINAEAPAGWEATAQVTGQDQAASAIVEAGSNVGLEVEVTPPENVAAGTVPITVTAASGGRSVTAELAIEITGSFAMTLTTPDGRLNVNGNAGSQIRQTLVVTNTGTAPLEGVTLNAPTRPNGWTVTFEPATVPPVPPNGTQQVTAIIQPTGDAIAGDYQVSIEATTEAATASQQFRVTVETSLLWGLIGVALIVVVLAGLWFVFQRYGRR
jgi:uncharacterized membrane protein